MSNYHNIKSNSRFLLEVELTPLQGERFQPTGFSDLGPARYTLPDGTEMLLVESNQSMANRMEAVCWDYENEDLIPVLQGLPYIKVNYKDKPLTNSILEAHRINSEYILYDLKKNTPATFKKKLTQEIDYSPEKPVDWKNFRQALVKYDPNSIIHGSFLEEISGRLRVTRALSSFIEAENINVVTSGGVKFSRVEPGKKQGEGNVPYSRTEFTAERIIAYFNIDLSLLKGYGFDKDLVDLFISLSLLKIKKLLKYGLRLRTACDLKMKKEPISSSHSGFQLPSEQELEADCKELINKCSDKWFANPPVTELTYEK
ncbi:MAG: type I-U CRISPR-associated RAMP protein Csb1/Cas7u [Deltaproteobacteria bacterium]|jgi:CRISPR-associated protein Csb1|nr:type I-U CRISPR-associated RAMP protein Csb1/Cas7u [Deltaproteobacteria bacterium]